MVGALLFLLGWIMDRSFPGKRTTLSLMMLATFVTTRYAYWRIWQTVTYIRSGQPYQKIDLVFVSLLLLAEVYAFLELYLGFFQTVQPLRRAPVPLPADPSQWPAVDAYIPTYNEDLDLVRYTVIAALNMDWPAAKLRVYLLDDGNREEFRRFAEEIGCEYISRPVHNGAFVNFNNARDYNQQAVGFNVRYLFHDAPMTLERRCRRFPIGADSSPSSCRSSASSHFVLEFPMSATLLTGP